jgi:hypothetical protein
MLLMFFIEIFQLLVEQTNVYYQQHLHRQGGPSPWLPDITLPDMVTYVPLALQMGHTLKDTLWLLVETQTATQSGLQWDHDTRGFLHITAFSAFCRQFTVLKKMKNMTDWGN